MWCSGNIIAPAYGSNDNENEDDGNEIWIAKHTVHLSEDMEHDTKCMNLQLH